MLEGQGYVVKGEIGAADVVAVRGERRRRSLSSSRSGFPFPCSIRRSPAKPSPTQSISPCRAGQGACFPKRLRTTKRCAAAWVSVSITVRMEDGFVETHADPEPYRPRQSKVRKGRLLREFARRVGDPNNGGATRRGLVTAYRQDALQCLRVLMREGPLKASLVAKLSGVARARPIMADDHYGWFERVSTGIYGLTPKGVGAVAEYAGEIEKLVGNWQGTSETQRPVDSSELLGVPGG